MAHLGIFRFEIVSIVLIPLATAVVLAGFEGVYRLQRHRRP
jgi:hypothetical protein